MNARVTTTLVSRIESWRLLHMKHKTVWSNSNAFCTKTLLLLLLVMRSSGAYILLLLLLLPLVHSTSTTMYIVHYLFCSLLLSLHYCMSFYDVRYFTLSVYFGYPSTHSTHTTYSARLHICKCKCAAFTQLQKQNEVKSRSGKKEMKKKK